ncbi:MAG TPA: sugar ABC transporter permease [Actinomycetaceae bacterium]|nr:sugar ABC transporter permease [Actinomycetaceae bacterium]
MALMTMGTAPAREAAPSPPAARVRRGRAWPFLAPLLVALTVWIYGPMLVSVFLAFADWNLTTSFGGMVGLDNFRELLRRPDFLNALLRTALYAVVLLPFATIVPMILAIMLWQRPSRAATIYRTLLFLPVMIAPVAHAASWRFLLNPLTGPLNEILGFFGLPPVNWLGDPNTALPVIVVVTSARIVATNMLIYSAMLATLDRRTVAAAQVEGATTWETMRFVVIPQLRGVTIMLGLLSFVMAGQWVFNYVSILTQGGPDGATDTVYFYIYTMGFTFFETGVASAASAVILGLLGVIGIGVWLRGRRRHVRA